MANSPLKLLVSFLQIRGMQTKAPNLVTQTPKALVTAVKVEAESSKKAAALLKKQESVIALLKKHHLTDAQIAKLVEKNPTILRSKCETTLVPKFKFLNENGFKGSLLADVISKNPLILRRSLAGHLAPALEYLRNLMEDDVEAILFAVKRSSWLLTLDLRKVVQPNVELMLREGLPMKSILKLFTTQPRCILCTVDRMAYGIEMVKKFGIQPDKAMFMYSLRVMMSMTDVNWKRKVEIFKSFGWSDKDIVATITNQPLCLTCSEDKIRNAMEFLVKTMKVQPKAIISFPKLVMYSLEKRTIPRCRVLRELQKKKLLGKKSIAVMVNISEEDFMKRFILKFQPRVPYLLDLYHGKLKRAGRALKQ